MPVINDAAKLYRGTQTVTAAYMAGVKVWPKPVVNTLGATLTKIGDPNAQISTSYSGTTPTLYRYYSSTNGAGWVYRYEGNAGPHNFDTTYSSTFVMKVDSFDAAGNGLASATTNTVTMGARPIVYVQRSWQGVASGSATYRESGAKRTDSAGLSNCYYGRFDSTWGIQKSLVIFNIPAEIRNCVSVDRVQVNWYNNWHFQNSGGRVSMVVHHGGVPATFPGSTGPLVNGSGQVSWPAPKPGQINGTSWYDIGDLWSSGRPSIKEEIRVQGMTGLGLVQAVSGQSGYGYAATNPSMDIVYTVAV